LNLREPRWPDIGDLLMSFVVYRLTSHRVPYYYGIPNRKIRWKGYVARTREKRNAYAKFELLNPKARDGFRFVNMDEYLILK
jgi:hypothetical protein